MAVELAQTISEQQAPEIPSRFVQPLNRRQPCHGVAAIPLVDLQELLHEDPESAQSTAQALVNACEEWGFFQIVNHGISSSLMDDVKRLVKEFLDLPMEEKMKRPMKFEPYHPTGYGRLFDFSEDTILDWVDALIHYVSPLSLKDPEYWPDKPVSYRETIEAYGNEVIKLVKTLLGIFSKSLGLESSRLEEDFGGDEAQFVLRVNHYPRCQQSDQVMGLSPHSDGSAMTVLLHDEVEGLQVTKDGLWWTVKPMPGALIVNMGDMMQLVSNGRYTSAEHRAVVSGDTDRISIVVFYAPTAKAYLSPVATKGNKPCEVLYKSVEYGDYLALYMNKELQGKARINSLLI